MQFLNGTSHNIVIIAEDPTTYYVDEKTRKLILNNEVEPLLVIPAGFNLNAKPYNLELDCEHSFVKGALKFSSVDPLPEMGEDTVIVVSNMYRSACLELGLPTKQLATIRGSVYRTKECTKPYGCFGLNVG